MSAHRRFMLDTDTVSLYLRENRSVASKLSAHRPSEVCLSSITLGELRFGADKRGSKRLHRMIDTLIASVESVPFDSTAAAMFGRVRAHLEAKGKPIGALDTLIAAHALALDLTLVTNNTKHFTRVPELRTETWFTASR